jgi:hypothetical protein
MFELQSSLNLLNCNSFHQALKTSPTIFLQPIITKYSSKVVPHEHQENVHHPRSPGPRKNAFGPRKEFDLKAPHRVFLMVRMQKVLFGLLFHTYSIEKPGCLSK